MKTLAAGATGVETMSRGPIDVHARMRPVFTSETTTAPSCGRARFKILATSALKAASTEGAGAAGTAGACGTPVTIFAWIFRSFGERWRAGFGLAFADAGAADTAAGASADPNITRKPATRTGFTGPRLTKGPKDGQVFAREGAG